MYQVVSDKCGELFYYKPDEKITEEETNEGCFDSNCEHQDNCKGRYRDFCLRKLLEDGIIKEI